MVLPTLKRLVTTFRKDGGAKLMCDARIKTTAGRVSKAQLIVFKLLSCSRKEIKPTQSVLLKLLN